MRAVEVRIHDEAFPADGGAGFLKIDAHHYHHAAGDLAGEGGEAAGIVAPGLEIVNRARAHDEEESLVVGEDEPVDFATRAGDEFRLGFRFRQLRNSAAGEGRARVSTTLISEVFCMNRQLGGRPASARKPGFGHCASGRSRWAKKWPAAYP